nr:hypothetical protein [Lactiplantibacillus plantarum]
MLNRYRKNHYGNARGNNDEDRYHFTGCAWLAVYLLRLFSNFCCETVFRQLKLHGNAETSAFAPLALWSAFVIGLIFIFVGIAAGFGLI